MSSNKQMKPSELPDNFDLPLSHKQIHPVHVNYCRWQQKQYDSKFNQTFALRGYKNIHRIAAVGHRIDENLMKIKKSCLKMVKSIEFDAYLCETSALKPLYQVLTRLKNTITCLNITIRRIDRPSEMENLCYLLRRLIRMTKLRFEFASTEKLDATNIEELARSYKRCFSLKTIETGLIFIPTLKQANFKQLACSFAKVPKLDDLTYRVQTVYTPTNLFEDHKHQIPNFKKIKKLSFKTCAKTGWTSMTDGSGEFFPSFIRSWPERINPIELSQIYNNFPISTEAAGEIAKMVPQLENLRSYRLEVSNSQFGELELMVLAEGFTHCKQLNKLFFKNDERVQISEECLYEFVKIISSLEFLLDFDLFFRKLKYSEFERAELKEKLSEIENIKFVLTRESLHVYKREEMKD